MASPTTHTNLLAGQGAPATKMAWDPAIDALIESGRDDFYAIISRYPNSSLCWALLAEGSLAVGTPQADVAAYAYARTGYHRGLDALRRAGWKGHGPVPWDHEPNQGFLRALWALSLAAGRIGEHDEEERCAQMLRDSTEEGYRVLSGDDAHPADDQPEPAGDQTESEHADAEQDL